MRGDTASSGRRSSTISGNTFGKGLSFVKLDCGILDSSLWCESPETVKVWITMLAMATPRGIVEATAPGIARRAMLSIDAVARALETFESPDQNSRSTAEDGKRLKRVDGGYLILSYERYRDKDHTATDRQRRRRSLLKSAAVTRDTVTSRRDTVTVTEHNRTDQSRTDQKNERTSVAVAPAPWSAEAIDDWNDRYGKGSAPGGRIGAALKPLVQAHGWDAVRPAWKRYLSESTHPSPSAQDFAAHYGAWNGKAGPIESARTRRAREAMERIIERQRNERADS